MTQSGHGSVSHGRGAPGPHTHNPTDHDHPHDHGDHGHDHIPEVTAKNERKILVSFVLILAFMLVEAAGGILSGSLALLADAGHMLTDAAALGLAYGAFRLGRRAADGRRTFGYARFEVIAGFVNAVLLFGIVAWIVIEAVGRFRQPQPVLAGSMFIVAVLGMVVNLGVLWTLTRGDSEHVNIRGAILHVVGDLLGSVGAIVAAVVIWLTEWTPIDPILSVVVSLLILRSAWALLQKTIHILLEGAPPEAEVGAIVRHLSEAVEGLQAVHHVHVWSITSGRVLATLQIQPAAGSDIPAVVRQVERELKDRFGIGHATVGIDWDEVSTCTLGVPASPPGHGH